MALGKRRHGSKHGRIPWPFRTWSGTLHGRTGTGCPSYDEENATSSTIRDRNFLGDLGTFAVKFSSRVGAARPRRPTGIAFSAFQLLPLHLSHPLPAELLAKGIVKRPTLETQQMK